MDWPFIIGFAIVLELLTVIFRFGFDFHSKSIQKKFHFPFRIHHLYIGILIAVFGVFYTPPVLGSGLTSAVLQAPTLFELGLAIAFSDLGHHFIVLPAFYKDMDFP